MTLHEDSLEVGPFGCHEPTSAALLVLSLSRSRELWSVLAATARLVGQPVGLTTIDELVRNKLVRLNQGKLTSSSDVQRAVLEQALPSQTYRAHLALAEVHRDDPIASSWHLALSTPGPQDACGDLAVRAARLLHAQGEVADALQMLKQAARLTSAPPKRASRLLEAATTLFTQGQPLEATRLLTQSEQLGLPADMVYVAKVLRCTFLTNPLASARSTADVAAVASTLRSWSQPAAALSVVITALERCAWHPTPEEASLIFGNAGGGSAGLEGVDAFVSGDLARSARLFDDECRRLARTGLSGTEVLARLMLARVTLGLGDLNHAKSFAWEALRLARATAQPAWEARAELVAAMATALTGQVPTDDRAAFKRHLASGDRHARVLADLVHAVELLGAGEWSDAYELLHRLAASEAPNSPELVASGLIGYLAEAAVHCDRIDDARRVVSDLGAADERCIRGLEMADLFYATAVLATPENAGASFTVLRSLDPERWPLMRARAQLALGSWLRRNRRVTEARGHLRTAQRLFEGMGAAAWEAQTQVELRAAGVRIAAHPEGWPDMPEGHLSPQQLEIARLAGTGLTNRQIGERLHLSPRTVGTHLYRIFPKLDVTSRTQLATLIQA